MAKKCLSESLRPIAGLIDRLFQAKIHLKNRISTEPEGRITTVESPELDRCLRTILATGDKLFSETIGT